MTTYGQCFLRCIQNGFLALSLVLSTMVAVNEAAALSLSTHTVVTLSDTAQSCGQCVSSGHCEQCLVAPHCCTLAVLRQIGAPAVLLVLHSVVYVALFSHFQQAYLPLATPPPK